MRKHTDTRPPPRVPQVALATSTEPTANSAATSACAIMPAQAGGLQLAGAFRHAVGYGISCGRQSTHWSDMVGHVRPLESERTWSQMVGQMAHCECSMKKNIDDLSIIIILVSRQSSYGVLSPKRSPDFTRKPRQPKGDVSPTLCVCN